MACNCNTISTCVPCSLGQSRGCPPDYTITPLATTCTCCPEGFSLNAAGTSCYNMSGQVAEPIPCSDCVESISTNCVFTPAIPCMGALAGTPLTNILLYLCSDAYVLKLIQSIGLNPQLQAALCSVTSACPPVGSSTPIISSLTVTVP